MTLARRHWLGAAALALSAHGVLALWLGAPAAPHGGTGGSGGIELTIALTGTSASEPAAPPQAPQEAPQEKPEEAPQQQAATPEPAPKPAPEPAPEPASKPASRNRDMAPAQDHAEATMQSETTAAAAAPSAPKASPEASPESQPEASATASHGAASSVRGSVAGDPEAERTYITDVKSWLERHKTYPRKARRRGQQGIALVAFTIARDGTVIGYELEASSGHAILDDEVAAMLERAAPLPPIPPELGRDTLALRLPVVFRLN